MEAKQLKINSRNRILSELVSQQSCNNRLRAFKSKLTVGSSKSKAQASFNIQRVATISILSSTSSAKSASNKQPLLLTANMGQVKEVASYTLSLESKKNNSNSLSPRANFLWKR